MNDQPNACPYCGSMTELIGSFMHTSAKYEIDQCLMLGCLKILVYCSDDEFSKYLDL